MDIFANTLLVANPAAQSGRGMDIARRAHELLREGLGADNQLELFFTDRPGSAKELLATQATRYSCVIALGGDGVIHEVANGLMACEGGCRTLGVIPAGSGNDYARTLGMSDRAERAVEQLLQRRVRPVDLGVANGEYFTQTLSFGLDAAIALGTMERRKKSGKHGTMLYLEEGLHQLRCMQMYPYELKLEGEPARLLTGEGLLLAVQNGPTYGGGFRVTPEASVSDGALDICIANGPVSALRATAIFLRAKDGHHVSSPIIEFHRAQSLTVRFPAAKPPCQIDGEPFTAERYEISVRPSALNALFGESL